MKREDFAALNRLIDGELSPGEETVLLARVAQDPEFAEMRRRLEGLGKGWPFLPPVKAPPLRFPLTFRERAVSLLTARWRVPVLPFAAAMALLAVGWVTLTLPPEPPIYGGTLPVHLVLYAPEAKTVELVGDFDGWGGNAMRPTGRSGYWVAEFRVPAGEYRYQFLVDGRERVVDATASLVVEDDFGSKNAVLRVGL